MAGKLSGATVLVVDDDELIALSLASLFEELGYEICGTATTAPEALRMAGALTPSLITMDINLGSPGEGFAVVTLIRTTDLATPVIFVTGEAEADAGGAIRALGRSEFVQKPFSRSDVVAALERLALDEDGEGYDEDTPALA